MQPQDYGSEPQNPSPQDGTSLTVTTVLTQDPGLVRELAYAAIEQRSAALWREFQKQSGYDIYTGRCRKGQEASIRGYVDDLNELIDMLGQVGWRKRKGK
jgi:hypothetical protein